MALYTIKEETLTDIGDAIRAKLGTEETISPLDMPEAISSIETNGMNFDELVAQGVLTIDKTDEESGVVPFTNADQLGGIAATEYALKTDTVANATMLDGKDAKYYIQPYNLLDNSDFSNPVNQRGQTFYTGTKNPNTGEIEQTGVYTIDRWFLWANGEASLTVNNGYITIENKANTDASFTIRFSKELDITKSYTLAIYFKDGTKLLDNNPIYDGDSFYFVGINIKDRVELIKMALYEGTYTEENLPLYIPKGYAVELAECQRYYRRIEHTSNMVLFPAIAYNTKSLYGSLHYEFRVKPTINVSNIVFCKSGISTAKTVVSCASVGTGAITSIMVSVNEGDAVTGDTYNIWTSTNGGYMELSADL